MTDISRLLKGYQNFRQYYMESHLDTYRQQAAAGQRPKVMVISCSDSRLSPSIILQAGLGEIFQVRNVANLVPPYTPGKHTHHSTSAALEYAVNFLNVEDIIVLGHSQCGGIRALVGGTLPYEPGDYSFVLPWVEIIGDARKKVEHLPDEERCPACEEEALKISLRNLGGFPWIQERIAQKRLALHAWHFAIETGLLRVYDEKMDSFFPLG